MTQTQIGRGPLIEAPTPTGRRGELLDVADVREGLAWLDPTDMFTSWNCTDISQTEVCGTDQTPAKTFDGPTLVDGVRFALYVGGQCKPLTHDVEADLSRVFDLRESRGVEKWFEVLKLGEGTEAGPAVSAEHALALMENALGDLYAGLGTIHMSPYLASLIGGQLRENAGQFSTRQGTKVVVGTGYLSDSMYGTGDVTVYRSEKVIVDSPDMAQNTVNVLVERAYVVAADCGAIKISNIPDPTP